jgi:hypothetical protein
MENMLVSKHIGHFVNIDGELRSCKCEFILFRSLSSAFHFHIDKYQFQRKSTILDAIFHICFFTGIFLAKMLQEFVVSSVTYACSDPHSFPLYPFHETGYYLNH